MKPLSIFIFTLPLLTACTPTTNSTEDHEVSRIKLLRSMTYTHRNLLELELNGQNAQEQTRKQLLIHSHCDLMNRDIIKSQKTQRHCQTPTKPSVQACITAFHRCIGNCPDFKQTCQRCERKAALCLKKAEDSQVPLQPSRK